MYYIYRNDEGKKREKYTMILTQAYNHIKNTHKRTEKEEKNTYTPESNRHT